ncbi:MAG TPA: RNA-binding protein [Burkholderiales bacterium]|nr:RNA-binding protein [Burkholderiales bacterium]
MHDPLKLFPGCSDAASLRCAIQALCTAKGIVSSVDIWTLAKSGKRQALCFVRTDPALHEQRLAALPGLTRMGNEMLFIVDLP